MPTIVAKISNFSNSFSGLNGEKPLRVTRSQFLKYAMTSGIQLFGNSKVRPERAITLALYKALGITCSLDFSGPEVRRQSSFKNLDQTEQANLSTWVGMAGAAFLADQILDIPQLFHAGALYKDKKLQMLNSQSRRIADLIGTDRSGRWHVLEAKARQSKPSNKDREKWKEQAQSISRINGSVPVTSSYCFSKIQNSYKIELYDPPAKENEVEFIVQDEISLINTYYRVLLEFIYEFEARTFSVAGISFKLAGFDLENNEFVYVGLHGRVFKALINEKIPSQIKPFEEGDIFVASDGVAIATSKYPNEIEA
ncbi:MAG: hypothetical protein AWU59_1742 [Methanolobus sp. T82-4]|jgi:hypothetical protein|nr:MAG: hypothetical protein AWU59_1742 [Methanolobus sp. T82-4]